MGRSYTSISTLCLHRHVMGSLYLCMIQSHWVFKGKVTVPPLSNYIYIYMFVCFLFSWRYNPLGRIFHSSVAGFSVWFSRFLDHTKQRATVGRTPLDEWSIRHRDLYLTTHNTYNRQTSMPLVGFKPTISAGEQPKTYALDRAAPRNGDRFE